MKTLRLDVNANLALEYVKQLRNDGLESGKDFDFAFYPIAQDRFSGPAKPNYVLFYFYNDSLATYYTLKWL